MQITISNATITAEDGTVTQCKIEGDAKIDASVPPGTDQPHPEHPILLPPPTTGDNQFWLLIFCPNPPPPHWEWISFSPGDPPERPVPVPPEPPTEPPTSPGGEKPFPPDGGWGYKEPWGWIYWPGGSGAGPKRRK